MKHMPTFGEFSKKINEQAVAGIGDMSIFSKSASSVSKLTKAADVIAKFLSKKLKTQYKIFPFPLVLEDGTLSIEMYTDKNNSMIKVLSSGTPGKIIGGISYYKDFVNPPEFTMTSKQFNIVSLLGEFVKLATNPAYLKEVSMMS